MSGFSFEYTDLGWTVFYEEIPIGFADSRDSALQLAWNLAVDFGWVAAPTVGEA